MSANTPAGEPNLALIAIALGVAFLVSLAHPGGRPRQETPVAAGEEEPLPA